MRCMVFCNFHELNNFLKQYYESNAPKLDYVKLFENIAGLIPNAELMRTTLFVPKPDDRLMQVDEYRQEYEWDISLNRFPRMEVLEGELRANRRSSDHEIDINDKRTYTCEEKGVDVALTVDALRKAYNNAYDIAVIMSADSDYINLYDALRAMGKIVYVVVVEGQYITKVIPHIDEFKYLDKEFFKKCLRNNS